MTENRKCGLCGRPVTGDRTCCGQRAVEPGQAHVETPMEKYLCPVCGKPSDTSETCCGKKAVPNPDFRG